MWCRVFLHYIDWTSHIPELQQLTLSDQVRLVMDRATPCIDIMVGYKPVLNNFDGIALSGGSYFPASENEQSCVDKEYNFHLPLRTVQHSSSRDAHSVPPKQIRDNSGVP
uniref:Uncharacterized protein n=1 Tax=Panagrolaimus davidi TaxID=227884 RepID=A0A914QAI9_9BILA